MKWSNLASSCLTTELARMEGLPPYGLAILQRLHTLGPKTTRELTVFLNEPPEAVETTESRLVELRTFAWLTERGFVEAASSHAGLADPALGLTRRGRQAIHRIAQKQDTLAAAAAG